MRRLCTICARGGSKGVPNKNIRTFLGKPLLLHSIDRARQSQLFDRIAVSSDSDEILRTAREGGADDVIERPPEMATDTAGKLPAILHALRSMEGCHGKYDILVDLDATSPLRTAEDVRGAVQLLEQNNVTSVITGARSHRSPYFNMVEERDDGSVSLVKAAPAAVQRRQDAPRTFDMNASIYVWRTDAFRNDPRIFYPDTRLFEMPAERSRDIDSELDFAIVEMLAQRARGFVSRRRARFDLTGKVAVVTGGAGILGKHFVSGLAEHGALVAIIDLDEKALDAQAQQVKLAFGNRVLGVACDVADPNAVKAAIARIENELGPIDILHNNAASKGASLDAFFAPTEQFALATWREIMAVNLDAMFVVAREVGTRMARRGRGSIVQTSSIYGIMGPDQRIYEGSQYKGRPINTPAVYAASKSGVIGLTGYLAALWGSANVRVNTLVPGGIDSGQNDVFKEKYSARVPLGRMAHADEMVGALIYLASDASSYVTGHTLIVDGGLHAW